MARELDSRHALATATQTREKARGRTQSSVSGASLEAWTARVASRWTLIDRFDRDGKRYVLAQDNRASVLAPATLSSRERQVLPSAALGRTNKEIAYELGLAHSTVRVLLFRAAAKLGVSDRKNLLQRFRETARV